MGYKKQFDMISQRFFEAGLLSEVYRDDKVCICNMANSAYVAFFYDYLEKGVDRFMGIMFPGRFLKRVVDDPGYIIQSFQLVPNNELTKFVFKLNDVYFNEALKIKVQTDANGPYPGIDLEFEEKIRSSSQKGSK